ncbi:MULTISPECIES: ABC transporter ATP-binding protein [unclassified Sulfurimonas]|jgi:iron complex transport system ATP-binding protein|uniref:ABC transporter ATP-binding protein n=1 Tax=unclassified Sulfurimonas TaxID=2623549 RepID=UPI0008AB5F6E|nr:MULTISPECIES: ABC transporter ATP-binding protein [unclassified Sulfurimonas]MBS4069561.1 ABC transporter ATP-binding protein [Sulfurimonas sp.]MDD3855473.1 ABC transporter ATP-binding protein [Sulfurimonas sp.]MDX9757517.1 ABC transporter ATP-binding protein [Sulfurimonas sp.]OHE03527.1 MAG: ABC transporter [Sulfurimonas sp. RIFOXYB12_FULL_35_9]
MELKPIIEVKNLYFSYKKHQVLAGVDLELYRGEVVSLLGPNGCGKSTLIKLILKLLHGEGEIKIASKEIGKYSHKDIASHVAYIPQYNNTPFNYTVLEMVVMGRVAKLDFFALPSAGDYEIANIALKKIDIEHLSNRAFGQLSGGQKQMVLLARAIAQEVNVFIMDEPVAGLDYGNQIRLLELINELSAQGYTFLKTTHYPDHALLVSSRVVVMNGGKIIAEGTPYEVITSKMIESVYDIKADIITHDAHKRCVPIFKK